MATVKKRTWTTGGVRKEAWRVRYVDQHGKTITRQFPSKKEADAFRIVAEGQVAAGIHTADRASVTVSEAANLRLATAEANGLEAATLKGYRELAKLHIGPLIGKEKLSRLTQPKVEAFKDSLLATRSQAMASKAVRELSMILADAMRRGLVAQNVASGVTVRRSKRDKKRVVIPTVEQLQAIVAAADRIGSRDPRLPVMVRIAMLAGLRQSELRGLTWADIDVKGQTITVSQRADRYGVIDDPKSEAGTRTVPMGPALLMTMKAWKLRCPPTDANLVFPNNRKGRPGGSPMVSASAGPISQQVMGDMILAIEVEAGLAIDSGERGPKGETIWSSRFGWHCLRHAAASMWIRQKIDLKRLQVWIGHANISLTLDTYGHLIADEDSDALLASNAEAAVLG